MDTKLKNSRNIGRLIIVLVLVLCSMGMMLTYWWTSDELDTYVPPRADEGRSDRVNERQSDRRKLYYG